MSRRDTDNLYDVLGVDRNADADTIKRAYRKLARKCHPDVSDDTRAEERFKAVGEAYAVLRDPDKRAEYDSYLDAPRGGQFRGAYGDSGFDVHDFVTDVDLEQIFRDLFTAAPGTRHETPRRDQVETIHITLAEAFAGAERTLILPRARLDEQGRVQFEDNTIRVQIPPGARDGERIRVRPREQGELALNIRHRPHPLFRADARNILVDMPVTPWEAALGATITVPTLAGDVQMRVPEGTRNGARLRLQGRGLPGRVAGDQLVRIRIETPPADDHKSREFYRRMAREMPYDPRATLAAHAA